VVEFVVSVVSSRQYLVDREWIWIYESASNMGLPTVGEEITIKAVRAPGVFDVGSTVRVQVIDVLPERDPPIRAIELDW